MAFAALALVPSADASITFVERGAEASGGGASVTASLPSATTAGDLLVATIEDPNSNCSTDSFSAPTGWAEASHVCHGSNGPIEIWYDQNAAGGLTSFTFDTGSSGANAVVQVSEWAGAATSSALDQTGTASVSNSTTSPSVSTSGNVGASGELAMTIFGASSGLSSFTPGSGWSSVRSDPGSGLDSDYLIGPPAGSTLAETITSSPQTTYGAAIATFRPGCSGGAITLESPPTLTLPGVTLNGYDQTSTGSVSMTINDASGAGAGWQLDATSTTLTNGVRSLPLAATTITSVTDSAASGNCSLPSNSISYPVTLPAGTTPAGTTAPSAVDIYNAAVGTGVGATDIIVNAHVAVAARAILGSYTSTWTLEMVSGP